MFNDQPPFDEGFAGVHHTFCNREGGYILLAVSDEDVGTGKLINEMTGAITNGGESVMFSQDGRAYLAVEQPNGLDGNQWKVYSTNGRLSWSGYSFIAASTPKYAYAYSEQWDWAPRKQCPKEGSSSFEHK